MSLRRSLLGSRTTPVKESVEPVGTSLPPETLTTGGLLLTGAGLALIGPLVAALLIRASGAGRTDAAATTPLVLAALAVVVAMATGVALFVSAWRQARTPRRARGLTVTAAKSLPRSGIGGGR
ncbi:hypothetical protein [Nocardia spumae]|uniref:hypothetical protein n=1 Tax=Nocardia spumae TaxID=2887190 RepID=UPI001D1389A8|nr:hypothetical protein [Nocardia spumae]